MAFQPPQRQSTLGPIGYSNTVTSFRDKFFGVRQNRFMVRPAWPQQLSNIPITEEITQVYVKAADIPEASVGIITVPWMGRAIKFSGERTYVDWAIQIYESNSQANDLRRAFEQWLEIMDSREAHNISYDVTADWEVWYNDVTSNDKVTNPAGFTRGIVLRSCFPVNVGTLSMDYDIADSFAVFPVTMAYDYWEPLGELR